MFNLENKTILITGGGSGIGRAMSVLFAKQKGYVVIIDMDEAGAEETLRLITSEGFAASFIKCNVADEKEVHAAISKAVDISKRIDVLINNAGIAHVGTAESTTEADIDRLLSVNVKGVYHMIKYVVPFMKEHGGVILNMASIAALVGLPDRFAYSLTKGAVAGMTLSVAKDYLPYGIRCNSMSPARVHTPFVDGFIAKNYPGKEEEMFQKLSATQPIGRMAKPEEIAYLALYLCSDEASFITGCDYPIDGGFVRLNN